MNDFEMKIVKYFQKIGKGKIDFLTSAISSVLFLAVFWIFSVAIVAWLFPQDRNTLILGIIFVAILHFSISEGFFKYILPKFIKKRKRPYVEYPKSIEPIGHKFSDGSIPSSHMTSTVAMLFILTSIAPVLLWPSIVLALFMSFARIHNGMHYPSDVLIGILLGFAYGIISLNLI